MKVETPKQQHEAMAKKILARRTNANNNTSKAPVKPAKVEVKVPEAPAKGEPANQYKGLGKKELRALCDEREPKIEYKKKTTIAQLIEMLNN